MKLNNPLYNLLAYCFTFLLLTLAPNRSSAQSDFYKMSIGTGVGITQSYADVFGNNTALGAKLEFSYYLNEFVSVSANYQTGEVVGGDRYTNRYQREFANSFNSGDFNVKLQLGLLGLQDESGFFNAIKGLYVGTGIGGIANNHKNPVRIQASTGYKFPGYNRSKEMFVPFMAGINFHIPDKYRVTRFVVSFNFQGNVVSGEGLDSYDFNGTWGKQNIPDIFTFSSIGISYHFGRKSWFGEN